MIVASDLFRTFTIILCFIAACLFPWATITEGRRARALWAVYGAEIIIFSAMVGIIAHYGQDLTWYRAPLIFCGTVCILIFITLVYTQVHRNNKNGRNH